MPKTKYFLGQNVSKENLNFPESEVFLVYQNSYGAILGFSPITGDFSFNLDLYNESKHKWTEITKEEYLTITKGYQAPAIYHSE